MSTTMCDSPKRKRCHEFKRAGFRLDKSRWKTSPFLRCKGFVHMVCLFVSILIHPGGWMQRYAFGYCIAAMLLQCFNVSFQSHNFNLGQRTNCLLRLINLSSKTLLVIVAYRTDKSLSRVIPL